MSRLDIQDGMSLENRVYDAKKALDDFKITQNTSNMSGVLNFFVKQSNSQNSDYLTWKNTNTLATGSGYYVPLSTSSGGLPITIYSTLTSKWQNYPIARPFLILKVVDDGYTGVSSFYTSSDGSSYGINMKVYNSGGTQVAEFYCNAAFQDYCTDMTDWSVHKIQKFRSIIYYNSSVTLKLRVIAGVRSSDKGTMVTYVETWTP